MTRDNERIREQNSTDSFTQHLERASEIVSSWPKWKRDVLGDLGIKGTLEIKGLNMVDDGYGTPKDCSDMDAAADDDLRVQLAKARKLLKKALDIIATDLPGCTAWINEADFFLEGPPAGQAPRLTTKEVGQ